MNAKEMKNMIADLDDNVELEFEVACGNDEHRLLKHTGEINYERDGTTYGVFQFE